MAEAEVHVYPRRPNDWQEEWAFATTRTINEINSKCNLLLTEIRKIKPSDQISPELQQAVQDVGVSARRMDRQTPDQKKQPPKRKQSKLKSKGKR